MSVVYKILYLAIFLLRASSMISSARVHQKLPEETHVQVSVPHTVAVVDVLFGSARSRQSRLRLHTHHVEL